MKIVIASDHTGLSLKSQLGIFLENNGYEVIDLGPYLEERTHYPIYAKKVANMIQKNPGYKGILICGSGIGMSISANKFKGIRACVCSEPYSAIMSIEHNNANVLCFGAKVIGIDLAKLIVISWLESSYLEGSHQLRLDMINDIESTK